MILFICICILRYLYAGERGAADKIDYYQSPPKKTNHTLVDKIKEVDRYLHMPNYIYVHVYVDLYSQI